MLKQILTFVAGAVVGAGVMYAFLGKKVDEDIQKGVKEELDARERSKNGSTTPKEEKKPKERKKIVPHYDHLASEYLSKDNNTKVEEKDPEAHVDETHQKTLYNKVRTQEEEANINEDQYIEITEEAYHDYEKDPEYKERIWEYYDDEDTIADVTDVDPTREDASYADKFGIDIATDTVEHDMLDSMTQELEEIRDSGDLYTSPTRYLVNKYLKEIVTISPMG